MIILSLKNINAETLNIQFKIDHMNSLIAS